MPSHFSLQNWLLRWNRGRWSSRFNVTRLRRNFRNCTQTYYRNLKIYLYSIKIVPKLSTFSSYSSVDPNNTTGSGLFMNGFHGEFMVRLLVPTEIESDKETFSGMCCSSGRSSSSVLSKRIKVSCSATNPVYIWNWHILMPCGRPIPLSAFLAWYRVTQKSPHTLTFSGTLIWLS